jgi:hypothetical protein
MEQIGVWKLRGVVVAGDICFLYRAEQNSVQSAILPLSYMVADYDTGVGQAGTFRIQ